FLRLPASAGSPPNADPGCPSAAGLRSVLLGWTPGCDARVPAVRFASLVFEHLQGRCLPTTECSSVSPMGDQSAPQATISPGRTGTPVIQASRCLHLAPCRA